MKRAVYQNKNSLKIILTLTKDERAWLFKKAECITNKITFDRIGHEIIIRQATRDETDALELTRVNGSNWRVQFGVSRWNALGLEAKQTSKSTQTRANPILYHNKPVLIIRKDDLRNPVAQADASNAGRPAPAPRKAPPLVTPATENPVQVLRNALTALNDARKQAGAVLYITPDGDLSARITITLS